MIALESQSFPQQVVHNDGGERGGLLRVQGGIDHMGGHQELDLLSNSGLKRGEVNPLQGSLAALVVGQVVVRIDDGRPMPRKMLAAREYTRRAQSGGKGTAELCHPLRVRAKRAVANNRVVRVAVHVQHGCKVNIYPHAAQLLSKGDSDGMGELRGAGLAYLKSGREMGEGR